MDVGPLSSGRWHPEIHAALARMIREVPRQIERPLATFDWDDTCLHGDVEETILRGLDARAGGDRVGTYERLLREAGMDPAYEFAACALGGRTEAELEALTEEIVAEALVGGALCERREVKELVEALRAHGWEVWVVSASAEIAI